MKHKKSFGVIGGDKRNIYLIEMLKNDGHSLEIYGFENIGEKFHDNYIISKNLEDLLLNVDYIILPIVPISDNNTINTPFSTSKIYIDDKFINLLNNKIIFTGKKNLLYKANHKIRNLTIRDYSETETFMISNAFPTAQSAICIALENYEKLLSDSQCLIIGFGRIGKVLAKMLKNFDCNITASTRKNKDISWIEMLGYTPIYTSKITSIENYDIIFNTVPHMILDSKLLSTCKKNVIIIDLASMPGGVDFDYAKEHKINVIHALGLPGKYTPYTAAELIKKSIYNIIQEEQL